MLHERYQTALGNPDGILIGAISAPDLSRLRRNPLTWKCHPLKGPEPTAKLSDPEGAAATVAWLQAGGRQVDPNSDLSRAAAKADIAAMEQMRGQTRRIGTGARFGEVTLPWGPPLPVRSHVPRPSDSNKTL